MGRLEFKIEQDEDSDLFVASWNDPGGGGITTQAKTLAELHDAIRESILCHFADRPHPREIALHFENDPVLQIA
jgi:predicted RNase H-like HicB family nuclease